jgi:hypothetical protein
MGRRDAPEQIGCKLVILEFVVVWYTIGAVSLYLRS